MKKMLLGILFALVLLTGCSSESSSNLGDNIFGNDIEEDNGVRLVCSQKVQIVDVDMIADFKDESLTYLGLKYKMDLSAYNDAQITAINGQDMCSSVKQSMTKYTDSFTNCKQSIEDKALIITADFDLDKLIDDDITKTTNIEEAKKELEKQGYTCVESKK